MRYKKKIKWKRVSEKPGEATGKIKNLVKQQGERAKNS